MLSTGWDPDRLSWIRRSLRRVGLPQCGVRVTCIGYVYFHPRTHFALRSVHWFCTCGWWLCDERSWCVFDFTSFCCYGCNFRLVLLCCFCFVSIYFVLFHLVVCCFVLFCYVSFCFVSFCLVLFRFVLFCSFTFSICFVLFRFVLLHFISFVSCVSLVSFHFVLLVCILIIMRFN